MKFVSRGEEDDRMEDMCYGMCCALGLREEEKEEEEEEKGEEEVDRGGGVCG